MGASGLLRGLIVSLCLIAQPGHANPRDPTPRGHWINVAGYRIDTSRVSSAQVAETLPTLRHQIEIVESAGLPRSVLAFFRTVPLMMEPSLVRADGTIVNGMYAERDGRWTVLLRAGQWPPERAILLHELLHAYHREVLRQPTPPIGKAYTEARREGVYRPEYREAYFLSNAREYFAVIGEMYLTGRPTFVPPFNCAAVQKAQPEFIEYLATLFGRRECR